MPLTRDAPENMGQWADYREAVGRLPGGSGPTVGGQCHSPPGGL
jgi:hypothetical protein